jgi:transposase
MAEPEPKAQLEFAAWAAVDWADQQHAWALQAADSTRVEQGELPATPEAVEAWAAELGQRFAGRPVAVALEQARGALLFMLAKYAHLVLFPVHPTSLARYRAAFTPSGAKDDPPDARFLLDLLRRHSDKLHPWRPDTAATRTLQFLAEDRRSLVDEKTRQTHRLRERLKLYFPQMVAWFADLETPMVGDLLRRWPTLQELQKARPATLRDFFSAHNCRSTELIEKRVTQIAQALPATHDPAVLEAGTLLVQALVTQIATLRESIATLERRLTQVFQQHPDAPLFTALPGAGPVLAPRLLAALGTQRQRFTRAVELQSYVGIAPVLERSGQRQWTHFRQACPKFVRQTFHEWASHSIAYSAWARAYYDHLRANGKAHHAAVRALAFKWIRILHRCWKDRVPYDENRYQQTLRQRHGTQSAPLKFTWKETAGFFQFTGVTP